MKEMEKKKKGIGKKKLGTGNERKGNDSKGMKGNRRTNRMKEEKGKKTKKIKEIRKIFRRTVKIRISSVSTGFLNIKAQGYSQCSRWYFRHPNHKNPVSF